MNKLGYQIGIVGGGAVGLTYAALLSEAAQVTVLSRREQQADLIKSSGINFDTRDGHHTTYSGIDASADVVSLHSCNAIIVAVKSYDTKNVAEQLSKVIKPDTIIITLQNGLEAFEILLALLGHNHVFAGVTYVGASRKDDNTVINGDNLKTIIDSRVGALIEIMKATKLKVESVVNIKQAVWDKMALNVAQNALSAVTNLNYGEMLKSGDILERATKLLDEFEKIAVAEGLHFDDKLIDKLKDNWRGSSFYPSMWQDLHNGRRTEIGAINGAISRLGKKYGIDTPYNDEIVEEINDLEKHKARGSTS